MADQSLARSVLDKLEDIDKEISELHNIVIVSKHLKQKLIDLYSKVETEHEQLFQECSDTFSDAENTIRGLTETCGEALENIEKHKIALNQEISELIQQKNKLNAKIETIFKFHKNEQDRIDSALSYLHTRQTDLTTLELKLQKAFSAIDSEIDSKLADYTSQLNQGIIDAQTTINIKLDYFLSGAEERISVLENRTNKSIEQIESKSKELQTKLYTMLNSAISDFKELLIKKVNNGLCKIEEKQTTFIDRQTSMVENNSVIIDQMQRRFSQEITDISQQIANTNDKINMIESGIEQIQADQITLYETLQNLNKTIAEQDDRLKKLENKKPWWKSS